VVALRLLAHLRHDNCRRHRRTPEPISASWLAFWIDVVVGDVPVGGWVLVVVAVALVVVVVLVGRITIVVVSHIVVMVVRRLSL
jgi:hypothetical protein